LETKRYFKLKEKDKAFIRLRLDEDGEILEDEVFYMMKRYFSELFPKQRVEDNVFMLEVCDYAASYFFNSEFAKKEANK